MILYIILLLAAFSTAYFLMQREPEKTERGFRLVYWISRIWFVPFYIIVFVALVSSGSLLLISIAFAILLFVFLGLLIMKPWAEVV